MDIFEQVHEHKAREAAEPKFEYQNQAKQALVKILEYKDGCIWKTKSLGNVWVNTDHPDYDKPEYQLELAKSLGGDMLGSLSTDEMRKGYDYCYRTVRSDNPEFIRWNT